MKKILFLDFEDSFTYNVVQSFEQLEVYVDVISWSDFNSNFDHDLLVLGPGPGHPNDYLSIFPEIKNWLNQGKKLFGLCLGHQIFWQIHGLIIEKSSFPLHGQAIRLELNQDWENWLGFEPHHEVFVQRYNSLAVRGESELTKNFIQEGEILISYNNQIITYQFHPESIGTTCPDVFFSTVGRYLL
jgi:anthranilate/para-aminobenzoate synthase component II